MAIKASNTITLIRVDDGQDGDPTGVTESATVPANPYSGMLWKCTGTLAGYQQNAIYRWNGSKWELFFFSALNVQAESLSAISADLGTVTAGTITGVDIRGSQFLSEYDVKEIGGDGNSTKGKTQIQSGNFTTTYTVYYDDPVTGLVGNGAFQIDRSGNISSGYTINNSSNTSIYKLSSSGLYLSDGIFEGELTAAALTKTTWINLIYASGFTTAEDNPCQYRIFYQLDGSRLIRFRGQFKKTSGKLPKSSSLYPFGGGGAANNFPSIIRPNRTEFGPALSNEYGGRIGLTTTPTMVINMGAESDYCSLSGFSYIID
ncbi:MAG: hypothetical protein RSB63_10780 [Enterococcus sp.]|uniref:hypothetical protein n=1 Tax=Enterococcus sp. TaxID=35783 RepID=UPI002FC8E558